MIFSYIQHFNTVLSKLHSPEGADTQPWPCYKLSLNAYHRNQPFIEDAIQNGLQSHNA